MGCESPLPHNSLNQRVHVTNRLSVPGFLVVLGLAALAQAQTFTTLYTFSGGSDGASPVAGVVQDSSGNLYGTTWGGGDYNCSPVGCGVVFEISTTGTETVLHTFEGWDGASPMGAVVRHEDGNLYGTTSWGGSNYCNGQGCGTVFKIDTSGNETVLHVFTDCPPGGGLIIDKSGSLFGTSCGIFKIDSAGNFTVLHSLKGLSSGYGHLTMDSSGNLYGLAGGGRLGYGALYRLSKNGKFKVLHKFTKGTSDGYLPYGSVLLDKEGNLYGTTIYGGLGPCPPIGCGTIWKANPKGKETVLHSFVGSPTDGCYPVAGVSRDSKGNLYGVTSACGAVPPYFVGTLYKLSAHGKLTVLHSFTGKTDGGSPYGEILRTANGTLFGTSLGWDTNGNVWSYVP